MRPFFFILSYTDMNFRIEISRFYKKKCFTIQIETIKFKLAIQSIFCFSQRILIF